MGWDLGGTWEQSDQLDAIQFTKANLDLSTLRNGNQCVSLFSGVHRRSGTARPHRRLPRRHACRRQPAGNQNSEGYRWIMR